MKKLTVFLLACVVAVSLLGCTSSGRKSSSKSSNYDYDKGFGYSAPKAGQSFSDYVKEQDPDLYNNLFK